jgi:CRISPR/Cas system-associated exonuclease Cas4 (RecB family)
LDSNPAYEIKSLKNSNTQQDEKIKDLNILLNKFKSQERYSDLNKVITLYQKDNAVLRKKILRLEDVETSLRFQLTEAHYDNNTKKTPSEKIENLKKDKDANFNDIENKIQFYREENARIIIDRSEIQKKLENAKSRLLINEQNKRELKLALDKLNQILESSNIQTIF